MSISFAQQIFVTYYEPGTSPGTGDTALTKTNKQKIQTQTKTTKNSSQKPTFQREIQTKKKTR